MSRRTLLPCDSRLGKFADYCEQGKNFRSPRNELNFLISLHSQGTNVLAKFGKTTSHSKQYCYLETTTLGKRWDCNINRNIGTTERFITTIMFCNCCYLACASVIIRTASTLGQNNYRNSNLGGTLFHFVF